MRTPRLITLTCKECQLDSPPMKDDKLVEDLPVVEWWIEQRRQLCKEHYSPGVAPLHIKLSTKSKMLRYHMKNLWVFEMAVDATAGLLANPRLRGRKMGISTVFGHVRYESYRTTEDDNFTFKIANDYQPHYARMLMLNRPEWDGVFDLRELFGRNN